MATVADATPLPLMEKTLEGLGGSTVFSTVDPGRKGFTGSGPLAIGLSVGLGHLAAVSTHVLSKIMRLQ